MSASRKPQPKRGAVSMGEVHVLPKPKRRVVGDDGLPRLLVKVKLWEVRGSFPYVAEHEGKEYGFRRLREVRHFAKEHGYSGLLRMV